MSASATVEGVLGRRSRLAKIDAALAADEQKLEDARRRVDELAAQEDAAVAELKRADPSAAVYALRSRPQQLRQEREALERSIEGLERGIAALQAERVSADAEQAGRELAERSDEARDMQARERDARLAAAKAFVVLVERWGALAAVLEKHSGLVATVESERLVERVGLVDPEAATTWQEAACYVVTPVPTTFAALLDEALETVLGPRAEDDAEGLRELNRHRARHSLPAEVRPLNPSARELADAYPDLRAGGLPTASVSGVDVRQTGTPEVAPWPDRPAA